MLSPSLSVKSYQIFKDATLLEENSLSSRQNAGAMEGREVVVIKNLNGLKRLGRLLKVIGYIVCPLLLLFKANRDRFSKSFEEFKTGKRTVKQWEKYSLTPSDKHLESPFNSKILDSEQLEDSFEEEQSPVSVKRVESREKEAAVKIQTIYRGYIARKKSQKLKKERLEQQKSLPALAIQSESATSVPTKASASLPLDIVKISLPGEGIISVPKELSFEERSDQLAKKGHLLFDENATNYYGKKSIYISERMRDMPGFGTASTRLLFKRSLALGYEGRLHNHADFSSHIFHLYMGMIPVDHEIDYVSLYWGMSGIDAVSGFDQLKEALQNDPDDLTTEDQWNLRHLKRILSHLRDFPVSDITTMMVLEAEQEIKNLKTRKASYLQEKFIPSFLDILEKKPFKPKPDTTSLGMVRMVLSDLGNARWNEAVTKHEDFVPFRRFEQLIPHMSPEQIERLNNALDLREKSFPKKAA